MSLREEWRMMSTRHSRCEVEKCVSCRFHLEQTRLSYEGGHDPPPSPPEALKSQFWVSGNMVCLLPLRVPCGKLVGLLVAGIFSLATVFLSVYLFIFTGVWAPGICDNAHHVLPISEASFRQTFSGHFSFQRSSKHEITLLQLLDLETKNSLVGAVTTTHPFQKATTIQTLLSLHDPSKY